MNLIVAADAAWGIGKDGEQMVYIAPDLKRFRRLTSGHPVLVGRKTLATFPGGRPLKNRRNLILSRDPSFTVEGGEVFRSLTEALSAAPEDTFVLGGGSDAGNIAMMGVPVLCSCGVRGEWNHTDREYAVVESMYERTELWCMVVAALDQFKK